MGQGCYLRLGVEEEMPVEDEEEGEEGEEGRRGAGAGAGWIVVSSGRQRFRVGVSEAVRSRKVELWATV